MQRAVQVLQQVRKVELRCTGLGALHILRNFLRGVGQQFRGDLRLGYQVVVQGLNVGKHTPAGGLWPAFVGQRRQGKARQCCVINLVTLCPYLHLFEPARQPVRPIVGQQPSRSGIAHRLGHRHRPALPRRCFQRRALARPCGPVRQQHVRRLQRRCGRTGCALGAAPQIFELVQQRLWRAANGLERAQRIRWQRIKPAPPIVLHRIELQAVAVFDAALLKQAGAVKRVGFEHAAAPAVDGKDGRLVHPLRGQVQPRRAGRPVSRGNLLAQINQKGIGLDCCIASKKPRGHRQPLADAFTQLCSGRLGEGHHQNLRRKQPALKHQPQVQRGQRERLAGARRGLDQLQAVQRQRQGVERVGAGRIHDGTSPPTPTLCSKSPYNTRAQCGRPSARSA